MTPVEIPAPVLLISQIIVMAPIWACGLLGIFAPSVDRIGRDWIWPWTALTLLALGAMFGCALVGAGVLSWVIGTAWASLAIAVALASLYRLRQARKRVAEWME